MSRSGEVAKRGKKQKRPMAKKRTDTKIAVLVQVMADMGFEQETIATVTNVPQRTVSDIANRRGYWACAGDLNELRESYRLYLREYIRGDAAALGFMVIKRLEEIAKDADFITAARVASVMAHLVSKF